MLLTVADQRSLCCLLDDHDNADAPCVLVHDPDLGDDGEYTAVAALGNAETRSLVASLPLMGRTMADT